MSHMGNLARLKSITPVALSSGSTNNYAPVDATSGDLFASVDIIRQAANVAGSSVTGLAAMTDGDFVIIENLGPGVLTLVHQSTSSATANRFTLAGSVDLPILSGGAVMLAYDAPATCWRQTNSMPAASVSGVGTGTVNKLSKFTSAAAVGNSSASDDGSDFVVPINLQAARLQVEPHVTTATLAAGRIEDWDPGLNTAGAGLVRAQANVAGTEIGGIVPPSGTTKDGRLIILVNHGDGSGSRGTSPLKLIHRSAGSLAVNRIVMPDLTDLELPYTGCALLAYEGNGTSNGSWFVLATSNGGRYLRQTIGDLWLKGNFPSALATGNNNDWAPSGWTDHTLHQVLVNTGAILTGLSFFATGVSPDPLQNTIYQAGIVRIIANRSTTVGIKVLHDSASSTVGNRIYSPVGDFEIPPNGAAVFAYDYSSARWRVISGHGIGTFSKLSTYQQVTDTLGNGNNNDWNPTDFSTIGHRKVVPGAASVITGMLAQPTGHITTIVAFGTFVIKHQDANSAANNRIYLPNAYQAGGLTLNVGDSVTFRYDATFTNWMTIGLAK